MTNKYRGYCVLCRQIVASEEGTCSKNNGRWEVRHLPGQCPQPEPGVVYAGAPARATGKTNRKGDSCEHCGEWLNPGKGQLIFCLEDSGCMKHHDFSGYHVYCLDEPGCQARRSERVEARRRERAEQEARAASWKRIRDSIVQIGFCADGRSPLEGEHVSLECRAGGGTWATIGETEIEWCESSIEDTRRWRVPRTPELEADVRGLKVRTDRNVG